MVIHNFFSDVLLSMLQLFEKYIFENKPYFFLNVADTEAPRSFFKSVQFNIGNRNWQLDNYKESAQLEFPAGIFSFVSDETAFGKTNHIVGHHRIWDELFQSHHHILNY